MVALDGRMLDSGILYATGESLGGGGVEWAAGGDYLGPGMQWVGLVGSITGGGLGGGWRSARPPADSTRSPRATATR